MYPVLGVVVELRILVLQPEAMSSVDEVMTTALEDG